MKLDSEMPLHNIHIDFYLPSKIVSEKSAVFAREATGLQGTFLGRTH
jgi:hypothetical protein